MVESHWLRLMAGEELLADGGELLLKVVQSVTVAAGDGVDRLAGDGGDFFEGQSTPEVQSDNFALFFGEALECGFDNFGSLALLGPRVKTRGVFTGDGDFGLGLAGDAAVFRAALVEGYRSDCRVEKRNVLGIALRESSPPSHEGHLHDILGIRFRRHELAGIEKQLRGELLESVFPIKSKVHAGYAWVLQGFHDC